MKLKRLLLTLVLGSLPFSSIVQAATVITDQQISDIATTAAAGGDVAQLASDYMAGVTADLIAQGLTGDELQAQVAVAIQELTSGLSESNPNFATSISDIVSGATSGSIIGVNQSVGANPNLDPSSLTSAVTSGAARAVPEIVAANPGLDQETLQAAVNYGATSQGVAPPEPQAFEAGESGDQQENPPEEQTPPTTEPFQPEPPLNADDLSPASPV